MKAIILAGGRGKRLRPITDYVPKPLVPIKNIPIIEWQIKYLKKYGVNEVIICTGYKTKMIENYLGMKNIGVKIKFSIEKSPLGTGGAIKKAGKMINDKSFFVINGDVITNIDLNKLSNLKFIFRLKFLSILYSKNKTLVVESNNFSWWIWYKTETYY